MVWESSEGLGLGHRSDRHLHCGLRASPQALAWTHVGLMRHLTKYYFVDQEVTSSPCQMGYLSTHRRCDYLWK